MEEPGCATLALSVSGPNGSVLFWPVRLHFERFGDGEPAYVFLHGFLGSGDNWRTPARALHLPGTFYLVDIRNHGRSPHASTHRYPDIASDLIGLLETEGLPAAHFLGHSMGGKAAMYLALHYPGQVSSLVVVDIAPRSYSGGHEAILDALAHIDLNRSRREEIEQQLSDSISEAGIRQFLLKNLARDAEGRFFWRLNLPVLRQEYEHVLAAVEGMPYMGPALFLRGELSGYIQDTDAAEIQRLFPHARIETIPRAGHWVHVDNPEAVIEALRRFWSR